jgi:hypothetical protein
MSDCGAKIRRYPALHANDTQLPRRRPDNGGDLPLGHGESSPQRDYMTITF